MAGEVRRARGRQSFLDETFGELLDEVPDSARIMSEEPFGAVAAMQPFRSLDEVAAKANALPYGLAAYVFSRSARTLREMTDRLEVGLLGLNGCNIAAAETPFGGVKETGNGHREAGSTVLDIFTEWKSVYIDYSGKLQRAQIDNN